MDDAVPVPQSIFVVVSWGFRAPCCISILQLETKKHDDDDEEAAGKQPSRRRGALATLETQLNQKEYVAHFSRPQWSSMHWMFSRLTSSSTDDLCMFPYQIPKTDVPLHGCAFDFRTKMRQPIPLPAINIEIRHIVTLGGCIYALSHPNPCYGIPFMCYDPASGFWEHRESFPADADVYCIMATAIWDDTILFNMDGCKIWAYDVKRDKWCPVKVEDPWCYKIEGVAAVLGDTIYALTMLYFDLVLALSIQRKGDGFVCSLRCQLLLHIEPISVEGVIQRTRHLVHLGKDSFCFVQSYQLDFPDDYQPIKLTNIKLSEENSEISMTVIDECVHLLRIPDPQQFSIEFCFSPSECKTTALNEGKNFCFNLDPYPEGYDPKQKLKTVCHRYRGPEEEFETLPEDGPLVNVLDTFELLATSNATSKASTAIGNSTATETIYTDAEGRSISIRNLLSVATFGQFDMELKKFGPSERFKIQFEMDDTVSAIIVEGCMEQKKRIDHSRTRNKASKKHWKNQKKLGDLGGNPRAQSGIAL